MDNTPDEERSPVQTASRGPALVANDLDELVRQKQRFQVIYADPPWRYRNRASRGAAHNHYPTMSIPEIAALPVDQLAAKNSYLHLWATSGFLIEALQLMKGWGFDYRDAMVWIKPQMGMGNYWRLSHEILLLGVRGDPRWNADDIMSWQMAPRTTHSRKPELFRTLIERTCDGPYVELFARRTVPGWTVWGNQITREIG